MLRCPSKRFFGYSFCLDLELEFFLTYNSYLPTKLMDLCRIDLAVNYTNNYIKIIKILCNNSNNNNDDN